MPGGMRRMSGWDLMEMINGGVASAGATVFTNPLDVLKTRLQVQGELQSTRGGQYGRTPLSALRTVVRQDGWRALQHGLGAAVAYNAVINGIRLGFFAYCDNQGWLSGADGRSHLPCTLGCAGLGGAMGAWAANPFYLLKIHLQSQSSTGEGHRAHYRGLSHGFRSIYAQWGVAGLYQGTQALVIRNVSLSMAQLASFAAIKDAIEDWGVWPRQSLWVSFGGGVLSGFVVIGMDERFKDQRYEKLRQNHRDLGVPWSDPLFPPNESSIGLTKVIPDAKDQEWSEDQEYSGVFRFRFWRFGLWVEVCIDDQLPTHNGELMFSHSADNNEFWGALLEKAYAKLHGSYETLDGGNLSDALVDFTSGVSEVLNIDDPTTGYRTDDPERKKDLFKMLMTEMEDHALMCCAVKATTAEEMEQRTDLGLIKGHAYGITAVKKVPLGGTNLTSLFKGREKLYLVRLQNPWGKKEWSGPFGDKSPEWSSISEKEQEKLGLTFNDDGEFWMPFDDFLHQFTEMSICRVINTSVFSFSKTWNEEQVFDSWRKATVGDRAGGCLNHPDTFLDNPQYRFDITKDEDEVIIQLSQEDCREKVVEKSELLVIGFHVMKVEANRKYRLHKVQDGACTSDYIRTKHIFLKKTLAKGRYVVVPTTFKPGETRKFLLRVFTDSDAELTELTKDHPEPAWWKCCASKPVLLTRVNVKGASGLQNMDTFGQSDPYCFIKCEGKTVKSHVETDKLSPQWNCQAVFYRKDPAKPIKVQIWNHKMVMDSFMGQSLVLAPPSEPSTFNLDLTGKGSKKVESMPGHVTVEEFAKEARGQWGRLLEERFQNRTSVAFHEDVILIWVLVNGELAFFDFIVLVVILLII
eukprot:maker-scaffold516_size150393-snap-gene-0.24 protein:Tk06591 transcript:maker-scaffold516_size150393-snap-gene-0.24-mRNA-1 annotation:"calpain t"